MKLFQKLFQSDKPSVREHADAPSVSQPPQSIHDNQRQALIGWLAGRLAHKLADSPGLRSVRPASAAETASSDSGDEPSALAARLVEWTACREDIYLRIKEAALPAYARACLLDVYEEVKDDLGLYVPERQRDRAPQRDSGEIWEVYRDVIYAATQGKFLLIEEHDVRPYREGRQLCSAPIRERADIPKARNLAKEKLLEIGVPQTLVMSHLLVISEAITNVLKHAREGCMTVVDGADAIYVLVEDKGPGFPLKLLPNTTLMAGYSTKKSLGQGFTLMMKMSERLLLATAAGEGSALILVLSRREGEQHVETYARG